MQFRALSPATQRAVADAIVQFAEQHPLCRIGIAYLAAPERPITLLNLNYETSGYCSVRFPFVPPTADTITNSLLDHTHCHIILRTCSHGPHPAVFTLDFASASVAITYEMSAKEYNEIVIDLARLFKRESAFSAIKKGSDPMEDDADFKQLKSELVMQFKETISDFANTLKEAVLAEKKQVLALN